MGQSSHKCAAAMGLVRNVCWVMQVCRACRGRCGGRRSGGCLALTRWGPRGSCRRRTGGSATATARAGGGVGGSRTFSLGILARAQSAADLRATMRRAQARAHGTETRGAPAIATRPGRGSCGTPQMTCCGRKMNGCCCRCRVAAAAADSGGGLPICRRVAAETAVDRLRLNSAETDEWPQVVYRCELRWLPVR